ncbi:CAP domain-containing protein [Nitrosococcus wardiae]|uniref:CAP domain-containing protein n=1 Tax=Nitrosococcus wardiae TaxID=1814290 RepID=A0A4P7BZ79_9GAMM|nr:CAP domain-containing protein [Nitrosococcus wardiae]QBQ55518.1 CAP domain-containing protein [Nitrosococcus wardiae]
MYRQIFLVFVFAWCLLPGFTYGQVIEEDELESIETFGGKLTQGEKSPPLTKVVKEIISRTNHFRREKGRPKLKVNPKLMETAQYFAEFMARTDQYGHYADGNRPAERAKEQGYNYCIVSENIASRFNTAGFITEELVQGFFQGWKSSPGHRKNILDPGITEIGVAVAKSEQSGYYYAVQMFGRPKSLSIEFQVTNNSVTTIQYEFGNRTFPLPPRYTRSHQLCRSEELVFHWPDKQESTTVQPNKGDHYTIWQEDEKFRIRTGGY